MFKEAATYNNLIDVEEYTDTVTSYITKCIDDVTHIKSITTRANRKPWLTGDVHRLLKARDKAFKAGDESALRTARANLSAFNTIIPQQLICKLDKLGLSTSLCNWLLDFLSQRPQAVRVGNNISSSITLSTGPHKAVCSALSSLPC
ncbi:hypothetical protein L3Q82_006692 [Scortum barcoo]|uniref:Uncharacterized protein n=1 Tax=Scortum barcoo TaxID=214431 RepID=A0ACB8WWC3_9TELE|nr:hypothetical protein L3Q82_006692 [Scortum barcoo]